MSRAFIVSLDGILAVFLVMTFILASGFFLERIQYKGWEDVLLQSVAFDVLVVSEKQGILGSFVDDPTSARPVFRLAPAAVCVRLNVYDSSGSLASSASHTDCSDFASSTILAKRIFIHANSIYLAEAVVWLR